MNICKNEYGIEFDLDILIEKAYQQGRADGIDECINKLCFSIILSYRSEDIKIILENLKEQNNE